MPLKCPLSTKLSTPWTVCTSKRKLPTSELQPKKRQRISLSDVRDTTDSTSRRRQQTLTQIHFAPPALLPPSSEDVEPIVVDATPRVDMPKESKEPREPRARKGQKKQRNTITQMDFLSLTEHVDESWEEGLGMIMPGGLGGGDGVDEKENVDPDIKAKSARGRRKSGKSLGEGSKREGKRRRTNAGVGAIDDQDGCASTPRSPDRGGVHRQALSEQKRDQNVASITPSTTSRKTRATTKANADWLQTEPAQQSLSYEKENLGSGHKSAQFTVPETPRRRRDVIPSSQSPDSVSLSSGKKSFSPHKWSDMSPLKDRSTNVTPTAAVHFGGFRGPNPARNVWSPKKKICVLKYGRGGSRKPSIRAPDVDDGNVGTCRVPLSQQLSRRPDRDTDRGYTEVFGDDSSASEAVQHNLEPEIPEISQGVQPEVIPSSQTDTEEEEEEIPETSQGLRRVTSTSSANRSEESLRFLPAASTTPLTVKRTGSREGFSEGEADLHDADIQVHDFGSRNEGEAMEMEMDEVGSATRHTVTDVRNPLSRLPAQLPQKERTVSTICDSQDEEDDVVGLPFNLEPPTATRTPFHESLTRRVPTPSVVVQPHSPVPKTINSPNLPPPLPIHLTQSTGQPPAKTTTTLIPTKLPPSSSSSPSLLASLPLPPRYPTTTQQSIHPASMARPSQVSTQDPTQPSWLPMSSMPFPNTGMTTSSPPPSPSHHGGGDAQEEGVGEEGEEYITIKDSSSAPVVSLRDIPPPSCSDNDLQRGGYGTVDLGLGRGEVDYADPHNENPSFSDRDEDLDPKSSPIPQHFPAHERKSDVSNSKAFFPEAAATAHDIPETADSKSEDERVTENTPDRVLDSNPPSPTADPISTPQPQPPHPLRSRATDAAHNHRHHHHPHPHNSHTPHPQPQPPLPRLHLPDSMLESLPGPPGWVPPWEKNWGECML